MYVVRLLGSRMGCVSPAVAAVDVSPNPPKIEGTTWCPSRRTSPAFAEATPGGGGGGGGKRRSATIVGAGTAASSGVETLNFGSSPGALLHPKMVHPPFSV